MFSLLLSSRFEEEAACIARAVFWRHPVIPVVYLVFLRCQEEAIQ